MVAVVVGCVCARVCVCQGRQGVDTRSNCDVLSNRGLVDSSDNHVCHPARVCDDVAPHYDTYTRGRSKQETAAGSQHYDLNFGPPPSQGAYDVDFSTPTVGSVWLLG